MRESLVPRLDQEEGPARFGLFARFAQGVDAELSSGGGGAGLEGRARGSAAGHFERCERGRWGSICVNAISSKNARPTNEKSQMGALFSE